MSRIRNQWLIAFVILFGLQCTMNIMKVGLGSDAVRFPALASILILPIWGLITYHCAYRKRGTAWLLWILMIQPIAFFKDMTSGYRALSESGIFAMSILLPLLFCLGAAEVWFWLCSLRYRKENLALKFNPQRPVTTPPPFNKRG